MCVCVCVYVCVYMYVCVRLRADAYSHYKLHKSRNVAWGGESLFNVNIIMQSYIMTLVNIVIGGISMLLTCGTLG